MQFFEECTELSELKIHWKDVLKKPGTPNEG